MVLAVAYCPLIKTLTQKLYRISILPILAKTADLKTIMTIMMQRLLTLICIVCLSTGAYADDKGKGKPAKVSKKMHEYLMSRVANKHVLTKKGGPKASGFSVATEQMASAIQDPDDGGGQTPSTEPMDANILERSKATPNVTAETTDLLGEQIDLNSGSISFKQTDISLPGNSGLEVAIRRTFRGKGGWGAGMADFSDWNLDIPHIQTTLGYFYASDSHNYSGSWGDNQGCSGPLNPGYTFDAYKIYQDYQYWNGDTLNVPGHVNDKLLEPTSNLVADLGGNTAGITRVTKSNWRIKCVARNVPGSPLGTEQFEGFVAYAPNGTVYTFDELRLIADPKRPYRAGLDLMKFQTYMMVSKVEDRFGNWVKYEYGSDSQLTRIHANDGREIILSYGLTGDYSYNITKVSANGRDWLYNYAGTDERTLMSVTRPDLRQWQFRLGNVGYKKPQSSGCSFGGADRTTYTGTITHPHGAVGTFSVKETLHGISNVDRAKAYVDAKQVIPTCVGHMSLQNKTLTGPGLSPMNWTYSYSSNVGSFDTDNNTDDTKTTFVTAPDGSKTRHIYNRDWSSPAQGMQIKTEQFDTNGTTKLSTSQTTYAQAQWVGQSQMNKTNLKPMDYRVNTKQVLTTLHHSDGDTSYTTDYQVHNSLGTATKIYQHNSATGHKQYVKTTHVNHISGDYYVLQLPVTTEQSTDDSNYTQTSYNTYWDWDHSYHSKSRLAYRFGQWQSQHEYRTDGTMSKQTTNVLTDQGVGRTLNMGQSKRGKPQSYTTPKSRGYGSQTVSSVIDDNGWVISTNDFNYNDPSHVGSSINYTYDNMGRLTYINPVDSQWADTSIGYAYTTAGEATGIIAGMFKQTQTKGGFTQTTFFDALLRPVLTKTQGSGTTVYQNTQYNAYNKATFKGYPQTTAGNTTQGVTTTFDGMQREKTISQYGATGNTSFTYLKGNKRKVSDNRNNQTTTTYLAYGKPAYNTATFIDAPEGVDTSMQINEFGSITKITQGGLAEHRYYDSYQRLCQSYRADTGKTVYEYNDIGEMQWYAEGASGATNSCSRGDVAANEKVYLTYDNLGRIKYKNFSNSATADVDYYYDPNGNVTNVNSGPTQWSYKYNTQAQTTDETLKLDGQTFALKYGYDSLGNQSTLTYPSGRQISYAPNALGQPTKAGEFATGASYHANGTLTNFTYGNGLKYNLTLNNRQLPEQLKTLRGSTALSHLQYAYDANGNTSSITDHKDISYSISMGYDGLDRLTSANGKWGAANFTYDTMGNITSKNMGSMAVSYVYDPTTKRLNSASVTGSKSKNYSFTYDKKGAVTNTGSVQLLRNQAGQVTGTGGHTYVYDGSGKRVKDTKNGKHRYSIYDLSGRMIYQWDQQTETITDYIFLGKERVTEAQVSLGNGSQSVDNTNVGYTGHQWDKDTGLNYMQARYYDPLLGRFLSNDPLSFRDIHSFNRYAYANNNPYKYVDLNGESATGVVIAVMTADAVTPDPTDVVAIPKLVIYGGSLLAAQAIDSIVDLIVLDDIQDDEEKSEEEILEERRARRQETIDNYVDGYLPDVHDNHGMEHENNKKEDQEEPEKKSKDETSEQNN